MPDTKLRSTARNVLSFVRDVYIAGGAAGLGAATGWTIFLSVASIYEGRLPRSGDIRVLPWVVIVGLIAGVIGGGLLRCGIGKFQGQPLWAIGFFLFGTFAGPVGLIALVGYAMAGWW
jgi:hypothetical protein